MNFVRLIPPILATLLLAAHLSWHLQPVLMYLAAAFPLILLIRQKWVPWIYQIFLILASLEWLRTIYISVQRKLSAGEPWMRFAIILTCVALFTALTALVFRHKNLRQHYKNN